MNTDNDIKILRELAKQYAEIAAKPAQDQRRDLWAAHFGLNITRPLVLVSFGMWNVWCREVFGDHAMLCQDQFFRDHERVLRMKIFQNSIDDDTILEQWITQPPSVKGIWTAPWGVKHGRHDSDTDGGAWQFDPPLKNLEDIQKLTVTPHEIDEEDTARNVARISDAIGDILPVDVPRAPFYTGFNADISTHLAGLRGLETLMIDMYEYPDQLHKLLTFMRDGILANNKSAEEAGDYTLTGQQNQAMIYAEELERPGLNSGARKRAQLWAFCAAQEYTLISPEFHDEFMFQYQLPILQHYGLVHYGCCENLTRKIDMLRGLENLRSIAVTPSADIAECARQIGTDYVISWRPNPTDMVCCGWNESRVRNVIRSGLADCKGCFTHIHLKDVETLEGDTDRLRRWVKIVRETADESHL